jgi:FSR family fosmidomycin resistance protein-like MFS transporter
MPVSPVLYLVAAAHFFNDIYMGFLSPIYPIVMEKFDLSLSMVGTISMVAAMASALSQPVFGFLFDRFGGTASIYLAPLLTGALISCLGIAGNYPVFLVLLFLGCLGSAAFHPKGASVTPTLSGSHREIGMAIFSAGGNLGFAAGPAVIAFFITAWGFRSTPILAVPAAAVAIALSLLLPAKEMRRRAASEIRVSFRILVADRGRFTVLLRLVFINFAITVAVRGLTTYLPVYMTSHSLPVTSIGVLFTVMLAAGAVVSIFVSSLSRRTGKRPLILSSVAGGVPLAVAGVLLFPSPLGSILLALAGIVLTFSNPLLILFAQTFSGGSPAMASSLLMGVSWGLAGLVMVPIGAIGEVIGVRLMLVILVLFPLVATAACAKLPRE